MDTIRARSARQANGDAQSEEQGWLGVNVAIVPHVVAEGMYGHDHAELTGGAIEAAAQEFEQALIGDAAKLLQELAVVAKVDPLHDRRIHAERCRMDEYE